MKVWSLFSMRIFKNMNNYTWTLIIWWKRKIFIYFIKCYWIKNLLSTVIQNKKYLVLFHKHEINILHVYYLSAVLDLVCLFLSFFMQNWIIWYICVNVSFNMFWNFLSKICVFKSFKNSVMFFVFALKDISSLTIVY